jgi:hypothetical protein
MTFAAYGSEDKRKLILDEGVKGWGSIFGTQIKPALF